MTTRMLLATLLWFACMTSALAQKELILGVHPYLQQSEVVKRFTPLSRYLSEQLGIPIEVRVGQSYQAHLNAIGRDQIDIAYLGPSVYVKTTRQFGLKPLLACLEAKGKQTFQGHIVVRTNSPITRLEDLNGHVFAFGDPNSTMSSLVPRAMLEQAGVSLSDLASYTNYRGHTNVALAVLSGDADAGAVKEEVYYKFESQGLRSLQATPAIYEHVFVTRADLPKHLVVKLRDLLQGIRSPAQVESLLKPIKKSATGLVPAKDSDYDNLRSIMGALRE